MTDFISTPLVPDSPSHVKAYRHTCNDAVQRVGSMNDCYVVNGIPCGVRLGIKRLSIF